MSAVIKGFYYRDTYLHMQDLATPANASLLIPDFIWSSNQGCLRCRVRESPTTTAKAMMEQVHLESLFLVLNSRWSIIIFWL